MDVARLDAAYGPVGTSPPHTILTSMHPHTPSLSPLLRAYIPIRKNRKGRVRGRGEKKTSLSLSPMRIPKIARARLQFVASHPITGSISTADPLSETSLLLHISTSPPPSPLLTFPLSPSPLFSLTPSISISAMLRRRTDQVNSRLVASSSLICRPLSCFPL
ncbi:hypothetical protein IE53DRAFT_192369 [Violaceomyces palustris]|uniref:Uncharacterized protein n=1 Tax=Violaceomyces palustris TaxID=1673888 RepID=A0ACD0NRS5_9BASI|nr:hypothetical protein IE53DRAFT_192369 [Violaceomyces palustris]